MDRMLYISMSGAHQNTVAQAIHANNLANASTVGFKQDLAQARHMQIYGPGYESRAYAMTERKGTDTSTGAVMQTGRDLDVAVDGDGWIAVQSSDGSEAYTRSGSLVLSTNGLLLTSDGNQVMGEGGPILLPPAEKIEIGVDGTISFLGIGEDPSTVAITQRIKLVKPPKDGLQKGPDGLMRAKSGEPYPPDATIRLSSKALEASNVNVVESISEIVNLARQFEMQVRLMKTAEQNSESAQSLIRVQ